MIKNEKSKSNFYSTNQNFLSLQYLSTNATDTTGNKKENIEKKSQKELNINSFIQQKNKFYISKFFNEKETKKFLESKDIALKRIKIKDEIENINNTNEITNNNCKLQKKEIKNEKKVKQQIKKGNSVSPRKKRTKNKILNQNKNNDKTSDGEINFNIINTETNCNNDSKDDYIHKFIIDNEDESENNFHKKLKREIKAVKTDKNILNKKKVINSRRTQISNKKKYKSNIKVNMSWKGNKKINPFEYSEVIKNLMVGKEIEVSSINDDTPKSPERNQTKILTTLEYKKDDTNKNLNDKNNSSSQMSINSSHESLMSILSDLI